MKCELLKNKVNKKLITFMRFCLPCDVLVGLKRVVWKGKEEREGEERLQFMQPRRVSPKWMRQCRPRGNKEVISVYIDKRFSEGKRNERKKKTLEGERVEKENRKRRREGVRRCKVRRVKHRPWLRESRTIL